MKNQIDPKILIRDATEDDIVQQHLYLKNSSDEFLLSLGVDPNVIRNSPDQSERIRKMLSIPVKSRPNHTFAGDIENKLVGMITLKNIIYGDSAEVHGHILHIENRRQGLASKHYVEFLKKAFATFELKILICEPSTTNVAINAFLQKIGLKLKATYKVPASGILLPRTANRYEIEPSFIQ